MGFCRYKGMSEPMIENEELLNLRKEIDTIDHELLELISKRFDCAIKIAKIKESEGIEIYDSNREAYILRRLSMEIGENESLFEIISVFESLLGLSKKAQKKALERKKGTE